METAALTSIVNFQISLTIGSDEIRICGHQERFLEESSDRATCSCLSVIVTVNGQLDLRSICVGSVDRTPK